MTPAEIKLRAEERGNYLAMKAAADVLADECGKLRLEQREIRQVLARALNPSKPTEEMTAIELARDAAHAMVLFRAMSGLGERPPTKFVFSLGTGTPGGTGGTHG